MAPFYPATEVPFYSAIDRLPTEGTLAHIGVSKYADHCPLFRQPQIYARSGLDIDRSTLANWMGKVSFHLAPVVDHLLNKLKSSSKLFMDETRCPVLDPGRGKTKTGYLWAIARDERPFGGTAPPGVVFCYADGRSGKHATEFLAGFSGTLQVDGYTGYNALTKPGRNSGPVKLAYCWAHARRKLKEVHDRNGSPIALEGGSSASRRSIKLKRQSGGNRLNNADPRGRNKPNH